MKAKHTPGPWVVKTTIIGPAASVKAIGRKSGGISDQELVCMIPQTNEEQVANTLLIQFAPDLLTALREIVSQIDQGGSGGKVLSRDYCITAARAAIAKAEGTA